MKRRRSVAPDTPLLDQAAAPVAAQSESNLPKLVPAHDLRDRLRDIHNYIYANDKFKQHAKVFEEMMKLLLVKVYDERADERHFFITAAEQGALNGGDGEGFATRLRRLFKAAIADSKLAGIFRPTDTLDLAPRVLAYAVAQLHAVCLLETDAKGAAFQAVLAPQIRGEKGQFFTPDPVKQLIVQIIDPEPHESVLDPACGSGGLLVQAIEHVRRKEASRRNIPRTRAEQNGHKGSSVEIVRRYAAECVLGVEIDPTLVRVARLNAVLHGDGHGNILAADALSSWDELSAASSGRLTPDSMDIVITNPPFGTKGKVDDPQVLGGFPKLAGTRKRQVPDILFLERIVQALKPGGRAGVVLPYGDLANSSLSYVRDFLRSTCHIFAVISLPGPTFKPAENSVKAAVLFIRKWLAAGRPARYPTFRAISKKVGYDMHGRVTYVRDAQGFYLDRTGRPLPPSRTKDARWLAAQGVVDEDISAITREWEAFRSNYGKEYLW
jgi:type I restriction enzyme M protein